MGAAAWRVSALGVVVIALGLLALRRVGSGPVEAVEAIAPVSTRDARDVALEGRAGRRASEQARSRATLAAAEEDAGRPAVGSASSVKIEGYVFHRTSFEPVTGGSLAFDCVGSPADPDALSRLGAQELALVEGAAPTATLDGQGRFAILLPAEAWVARARASSRRADARAGL